MLATLETLETLDTVEKGISDTRQYTAGKSEFVQSTKRCREKNDNTTGAKARAEVWKVPRLRLYEILRQVKRRGLKVERGKTTKNSQRGGGSRQQREAETNKAHDRDSANNANGKNKRPVAAEPSSKGLERTAQVLCLNC